MSTSREGNPSLAKIEQVLDQLGYSLMDANGNMRFYLIPGTSAVLFLDYDQRMTFEDLDTLLSDENGINLDAPYTIQTARKSKIDAHVATSA